MKTEYDIIKDAVNSKPVHVRSWNDVEDGLEDLLLTADKTISMAKDYKSNEDLEYFIEVLAMAIKTVRAFGFAEIPVDFKLQIRPQNGDFGK